MVKRLLLLALPLFLLIGCQKKSETKNVVRLNLREDLVSLDPRLVTTAKDLSIQKHLYEGLTRLDQDAIPQPALAEKVEISEDLMTYTFHLRKALWSNGNPVTAQELVSSWRQVVDPSFACVYAYMLYPIKNARLIYEGKSSPESLGVAATSEDTFVVELETPTPYFLELTAFPTYFPVHAKSHGNSYIFNGPFQLTNWEPQNRLLLEKNPSYWDAKSVSIDRLDISVIQDNNTESQLFDTGVLDWLGQPLSNSIVTERIGKLREEGKLFSYPVAGTYWFQFNTEKKPFDNRKMRRAFGLAVNRQEIITHVLFGNQTAATGPTPPSMGLHENPYFPDGDVEAARTLFEEALVEMDCSRDSLPEISFSYHPGDRHSLIAQLMQQQWQQIFSIPISLQAEEYHFYRRNAKEGLFVIGKGEWIGDFNDPISFLEVFESRENETHDSRWENAEYNSLLQRSRSELDSDKRRTLLAEAEKILVDEMPIIPVYHYAFDYAKKSDISGVILSPLGLADFKYVKKQPS